MKQGHFNLTVTGSLTREVRLPVCVGGYGACLINEISAPGPLFVGGMLRGTVIARRTDYSVKERAWNKVECTVSTDRAVFFDNLASHDDWVGTPVEVWGDTYDAFGAIDEPLTSTYDSNDQLLTASSTL